MSVTHSFDSPYYHIDPKNDIEKDKICERLGIRLFRIRDSKCVKIDSTSTCYYRKNRNGVNSKPC